MSAAHRASYSTAGPSAVPAGDSGSPELLSEVEPSCKREQGVGGTEATAGGGRSTVGEHGLVGQAAAFPGSSPRPGLDPEQRLVVVALTQRRRRAGRRPDERQWSGSSTARWARGPQRPTSRNADRDRFVGRWVVAGGRVRHRPLRRRAAGPGTRGRQPARGVIELSVEGDDQLRATSAPATAPPARRSATSSGARAT